MLVHNLPCIHATDINDTTHKQTLFFRKRKISQSYSHIQTHTVRNSMHIVDKVFKADRNSL